MIFISLAFSTYCTACYREATTIILFLSKQTEEESFNSSREPLLLIPEKVLRAIIKNLVNRQFFCFSLLHGTWYREENVKSFHFDG